MKARPAGSLGLSDTMLSVGSESTIYKLVDSTSCAE